ncbi:JAB domain-containing protein [Rickettsiales endosymbiont of Paramecium tredecaurelia]|uniref:RadC family protein n=1 Tax=Candidatus Sarmatiella mevalonica TaxID=2770581 RepID=UPI001920B549|nr:DNA repair protein RadC [Candidatus Sarmatiella mevalonica]MBL3285127.1 JAB domain-containing protein [Candidatus Sarmatiella mevalonica]
MSFAKQNTKPHYIGHRQRTKDKFLKSQDYSYLEDYELIEILLFYAINRKDVKPLAKHLMHGMGDIASLLHIDPKQLESNYHLNKNFQILICIIRELMNRCLKQQITKRHIISSWDALMEYLKFSMGYLRLEQFRIIYLNKKNIVLADEIFARGTIDQAPIYIRELIKTILFHEAAAIVLVHNHPSGIPAPSKSDIDITQRIKEACNSIGVNVHDHVIITREHMFSFKAHLLL